MPDRALLIPICLLFSTLASAEPLPPNVILFMADDMGMGDTSAYQDITGNPDDLQLQTPNMERLANRGVRFTNAHTPASRCTPTRYGLLTGRYPWRSRLKYWVLFGSQGDPLIEPGRPTLATLFRDQGYVTGITGKWHVGLRYRNANGKPAAEFLDADLSQPMHTTPLDHGFDFVRITSRSHGTSGPDAGGRGRKRNAPDQNVGPGHIHGRDILSATGEGRQLVANGPDAYVLTELGGRHSDNAIEFLETQCAAGKPFFLYYPSNSNHSPYTTDDEIAGIPVVGRGLSKTGKPMPRPERGDYIYENDVALGRLMNWLEANDDPRNPGHKLIDNTIVIFTSDNGAEIKDKYATGPVRSHKGSCYEGGHLVPFLVSCPARMIGDGDPDTPGRDQATPLVLTDLFATFAEILNVRLPTPGKGERGAEDSFSALAAMQGGPKIPVRPPMFFADHKDAKGDNAVAAMTMANPGIDGVMMAGTWKVFFTPALIRSGTAEAYELYELDSDPREEKDRIDDPELATLIEHLEITAANIRNSGGHRLAQLGSQPRTVFDFTQSEWHEMDATGRSRDIDGLVLTMSASRDGKPAAGERFDVNPRGLGVTGGKFKQVDSLEALHLAFNHDVLVESVSIVAGNGTCGGSLRVGDHAPLAIYCIDADNDAKEQQGILSDLGVLKKGQTLTLDSRPHLGVEAAGQWRLGRVVVRRLSE